MKVLVRNLHERLLFCISASPYKSHFLLKGSSRLYALDGFKARPTIDIDLLGERISNDRDSLKRVFQKVCSVECEDDGVRFDADSIVVTPYPVSLDYPLFLPDVPAVELYAYSLETLIAEKFHTMVDRDESNSRMKDFFDVYQLFTYHEIDKALLEEAIVSAFKNRNTSYKDNLALFTNTFAQDDTRNAWWKAFLKKIRWKEQIDFSDVMNCIKENLQEYWKEDVLGR